MNVPELRINVVLGSIENDDGVWKDWLIRRLLQSSCGPIHQFLKYAFDDSARNIGLEKLDRGCREGKSQRKY